jgi:hypothetical protein
MAYIITKRNTSLWTGCWRQPINNIRSFLVWKMQMSLTSAQFMHNRSQKRRIKACVFRWQNFFISFQHCRDKVKFYIVTLQHWGSIVTW